MEYDMGDGPDQQEIPCEKEDGDLPDYSKSSFTQPVFHADQFALIQATNGLMPNDQAKQFENVYQGN
jgi:hypothetical protein